MRANAIRLYWAEHLFKPSVPQTLTRLQAQSGHGGAPDDEYHRVRHAPAPR
jgi:hypothetical protein